jgi:hypothetical protein
VHRQLRGRESPGLRANAQEAQYRGNIGLIGSNKDEMRCGPALSYSRRNGCESSRSPLPEARDRPMFEECENFYKIQPCMCTRGSGCAYANGVTSADRALSWRGSPGSLPGRLCYLVPTQPRARERHLTDAWTALSLPVRFGGPHRSRRAMLRVAAMMSTVNRGFSA